MFPSLATSLVLMLATTTSEIESRANQPEEGSRQPLYVRIYDYARVSPEVLAEAKNVAGSIFRKIGVEISWSDHSFSGSSVEGNLLVNQATRNSS